MAFSKVSGCYFVLLLSVILCKVPVFTFMRSYLSSTSWIQEMNCRALKRSLTDLFSSP